MPDAIDDLPAAVAALQVEVDAVGARIADNLARSTEHLEQRPTRPAATGGERHKWIRWERQDAELAAERDRLKADLAQLEQRKLAILAASRPGNDNQADATSLID